MTYYLERIIKLREGKFVEAQSLGEAMEICNNLQEVCFDVVLAREIVSASCECPAVCHGRKKKT